jgi:hypothetical protein
MNVLYVFYVMSQHDNGYSILLYTPAVPLDKHCFILTRILWKILYIILDEDTVENITYYTWNDLGPYFSVGSL